jgi:outer membrane lipoprotein-sorting protein
MLRSRQSVAVSALLVLLTAVLCAVQAEEWTVKSACKRIDKATKGLRGVTGTIEWVEVLENQQLRGSGDLAVDLTNGMMRGEVGGDNPRVIIASLTRVHTYDERTATAKTYHTVYHRDLLAQYAPVGFWPRGSDLREFYKIAAVQDVNLDGTEVLHFVLEPKEKVVLEAIPMIELWVDKASWLPARTELRHAVSGMKITARFSNLTVVDRLDPALFRPDWPEGTQVEVLDR